MIALLSLLLPLFAIALMQGIYKYVPETNHVSTINNLVTIPYL